MTDQNPTPRRFFARSETGDLIQAKDWSKTPLGPVEQWPQSLCTAVDILLNAGFPTVLHWGPELSAIYNDAAQSMLGIDSESLGCAFPEPYPELEELIRPMAEKALRGDPSSFASMPVEILRGGRREEAWFDWSCSPVHDDEGAISGVLVMAGERTASVLAERRKSFLLQLHDALRERENPGDILMVAAAMVGRHLRADRVSFIEPCRDESTYLVEGAWSNSNLLEMYGSRRLAELGEPVLEVLREGKCSRLNDARQYADRFGEAFAAFRNEFAIGSMLSIPVVRGGRLSAILLVHQAEPRAWTDDEAEIARGAAGRVWGSVKRARAEMNLRESERRYRALEEARRRREMEFRAMFESSAAGVAQANLDGRLFGVNRKYIEMLGYTEEELTRLSISDITHPGDRERNERLLQSVLDGEISEYTFEKRYRRKDGRYIWVESAVTAVRDNEGRPAYWLAVAIDVTQRKQIEEALRESEERYRTLFYSLDQGFCVLEVLFDDKNLPSDYRFLETNQAFERQTGLKNVAGKRARELFAELNELSFETYGKVAITRQPVRFETYPPAIKRWFEVYAFPIGGIDAHQVALLFSDITSRRQHEADVVFLAELTADFSRLTDSDDIMRTSAERIARHLRVPSVYFAEVNEEENLATIIYHRHEDGIPSAVGHHRLENYMSDACRDELRNGRTVAVDDVRTDPTCANFANAHEAFGTMARIDAPQRSDGRWKFMLAVENPQPRHWRQDEIELVTDLSARLWLRLERARADEALRQSEQDLRELSRSLEERVVERTSKLQEQTARLRRLAAELASAEQRERKRLASLLHDDLQQLLVAANMQIGILRQKENDPELAEVAQRAGQWIGEAVNSARDLTRRLRPPALYEDGLSAALDWLASEMEEKNGLSIELAVDDVTQDLGDEVAALLFDCVRELLLNITKYAGVNHAGVRIKAKGSRLLIIVTDEGGGFDVAKLADGRRGGFGLFSIRERLAALTGDMTIESAPGNGTRVVMEIPLAESSGQRSKESLPVFISAGRGRGKRRVITTDTRPRVLVVAGRPIVRQGIAALVASDERLLLAGEAAGGVEAIEALERDQPDVVLIEAGMAGMSGITATSEICRRWPRVVVIGIPGQNGDASRAGDMIAAGAAASFCGTEDFGEISDRIVKLAQEPRGISPGPL